MTQDKSTPRPWRTCRAHDDDAVGITRGEGAVLLAEVYGPMRRERAALIVTAVNTHADAILLARAIIDYLGGDKPIPPELTHETALMGAARVFLIKVERSCA